MKKALITGITGQDGSYLAEQLLDNGYEVHGMVRRVAGARERMWRLAGILGHEQLHLHQGHIESLSCVTSLVEQVLPDELYHLAAQSFVASSFTDPFGTLETNVGGTMNVLWAVRHRAPECRVYFAGSSEQFGAAQQSPQNEDTPFRARSPYGISKIAGFELTRNYREAYNLFACSGILFNHESPRRGDEFVTQKIVHGAVRIHHQLSEGNEAPPLLLGNLDACRDWGHARDYVQAMRLMLATDTPDDFVIATGHSRSVRDFCAHAFGALELDYQDHVAVDPEFYRPADVELLCGSAAKARRVLGWEPQESFGGMIEEMTRAVRRT
jgi:GDPmannose 4,6-dehydratase